MLSVPINVNASSPSSSGPVQSGPFYNSAGIYFGNADIGAADQTGGTLGTPQTGAGGISMGTWLLIAGAGVVAWYLLHK